MLNTARALYIILYITDCIHFSISLVTTNRFVLFSWRKCCCKNFRITKNGSMPDQTTKLRIFIQYSPAFFCSKFFLPYFLHSTKTFPFLCFSLTYFITSNWLLDVLTYFITPNLCTSVFSVRWTKCTITLTYFPVVY